MAHAAPDQELARAFAALSQGRTEGLEPIWRILARPLHHYAFALVGSPEEADDVLSEVLLRLVRTGPKLRRVRDPKAYLYAMTRNAARSLAQRLRRQAADALAEYDRAVESEGTEAVGVRRAVLSLPLEQREALVLHVWGGLTFAEVARITGVSLNTAASRYRYALEKLRRMITDDER